MKTLYGVGVGPGDPELVTLKAIRVIQEANYVFIPRPKPNEQGMAESIVREYLAGKQVIHLHFPMGPDNSELYKHTAETIEHTLKHGDTGAFITIGDPTVYSTFICVMCYAQALGMEVRIIPGIPSFTAAAAALQQPITIKDDQFYLADGGVDEDILAHVQSVCVLKPRKGNADTLKKLEQSGFEYAYIKRCSLPQEEILRDRDQILNDRDYMTVLFARKKHL